MTDRDRDKSVEQWLRQTPVPGAQADDCLDAETVAAWAEGLLEGPQRATAEAHASNCARCQAMLAVMVRTTPAAAASTGSPLRKWLMMLGPPMAAAAAVALWFAVGQNPRAPVLDGLIKQQAKAEVEAARQPGIPPSASSVPVEEDRQLPLRSNDRDVPRLERAAPLTLADARKEREALESAAKTAAVAPATAGNEKKDLAASTRMDTITGGDRLGAAAPAPVASPSPPPPPAAPRPTESQLAAAGSRPDAVAAVTAPPPQQQANQAQNQAQNQAPSQNQFQAQAQSPPAPRQQQALEERVVVADKPAASTADAGAVASRVAGPGGVAGGVQGYALSTRAQAGAFELVPPASTIRWRVVDGRIVQRSLDAGATWANQHTADSGVFFTAGTAPSSTVGWLVGRAGAIIVTTDGVRWERVTFPEAADLTSVVAPDARRATVTTVDGRKFATADGGRTWTRQ